MKYYTEGLINEKPKFNLLPGRKSKYYIALGIDADLTLMWIEEKYGGRMRSFPCLIKEGDCLFSYAQSYVLDAKAKNDELIQKWSELINTETVRTKFDVKTVGEKEFFEKYRELKKAEQ
jgi:hypothetical protein